MGLHLAQRRVTSGEGSTPISVQRVRRESAADPKRVTKAVDHALTSRRPKRRYLLDIVSRTQKAVVAITPTAINDAVLAAATTSK
jgi:hypothetical protein